MVADSETTSSSVKTNLLGTVELALLMPQGTDRFSNDRDTALRSFIVPALLFPASLIAVYMSPGAMADTSTNTIALLYSLRLFASWVLFFGFVYWILREVGRMDHFYRFVTANNWLTVPATAIFIPVALMVVTGSHTMTDLYPFMLCLMGYTYFFTAFMAAHVLRVPLEFAGFLAFIAFAIDQGTTDFVQWVGGIL